MSKKKVSAKPYDGDNAKKQVGLCVKLHGDGTLHFPEGARYRFKRIDGDRYIEIVAENGDTLMHIVRACVMYIGGPMYVFRDSEFLGNR